MTRIIGLSLLIAATAFPQTQTLTVTGSNPQTRSGQVNATFGFSPGRFAPPAIQNAPYAAEEIQEHEQTLGDGTHITQTPSRRMMYRDSQGRTRVERPLMMGPNAAESPLVVEITDPVSGFQYTLDAQNKVAHRVTLQPFPGANGAGGRGFGGGGVIGPLPPTVAPPGPPTLGGVPAPAVIVNGAPNRTTRSVASESLGTQVMEGVLAEGQRQVMTIPAGAQGNDRDMQIVTETWNASELRMAVYRKTTDPRTGENTTRLRNISRNEPDPQLFLPPADYQVIDETGPFTIRSNQ